MPGVAVVLKSSLLLLLLPKADVVHADISCQGVGFYPDPADCSRFYRCTDTLGTGVYQQYMFECAPGTVFDQRISVCNHPWAVPACGGSAPPTLITSTQPPPPPPTSSSAAPPATTDEYTPSAGSAYKCSAPGFVKYEQDCQKFWLCKENPEGSMILESLLYRCPEGYLFGNERLRCVPVSDVTCQNPKTSLTDLLPFTQLQVDSMEELFVRYG